MRWYGGGQPKKIYRPAQGLLLLDSELSVHIIHKRFSKTGLKYYNNRRKQHKTRQFRTMTVQMPDMTF